ncbi:hypothetical protein, partial [Saccharothrix longispora]|uniref:hypothetical protein n=1 Tax=Saccharothrix longispora TaxID=33920 RepID=UPI0028FD5E7F|nr:hypothetical protein [Saccharothrix longispora]
MSDLASSPDAGIRVRSFVIRDLLLGKHGTVEPRGVQIRGCQILGDPQGSLNLNSIKFAAGLRLYHCWLNVAIEAHGARIPWLQFKWVHLPHLHADRVVVDGSVELNRTVTTRGSQWGMVRMVDSQVGGNLELGHCTLSNDLGAAVQLEGIRITGSLILRDTVATVTSLNDGVVKLTRAQIGGDVTFNSARLENVHGPVLSARSLVVAGSVLFEDEFVARADYSNALIQLANARIGASLTFCATSASRRDATLTNPRGNCLDLRSAIVNRVAIPDATLCGKQEGKGRAYNGRNLCLLPRYVELDGFSYTSLDPRGAGASTWLHWLLHHSPRRDSRPI